MNTRQLEAFSATMRSGSITGAATRLHISQPSVSRLISDLEDSIGFKLFVQNGRGLTPTLDGKTFYHAVEGMFMGMDRLEEFANSIKGALKGGLVTHAILDSDLASKLLNSE